MQKKNHLSRVNQDGGGVELREDALDNFHPFIN